MEAWGPRLGVPTDSTNWFFNNEAPIYFERIFGSTEQGDFTLLNCRMTQSSFSLGSPQSKQFLTCSTVIKGIHVSDTSGFHQVRAKIANLDEWASLASLMPDGNFGYKIRRNAGPTVRLQEGVTLSIQPNISNGQDRRSARIEIQNDLYLTFDSAIEYSDILPSWINPFVDLVTLATSHPSAVREFELSDSASPGTWHQVGLQLGFDPSSRSIGIWAEKTVLKYADLNPEEHFPRWYNMAHKLQGIFSYTFGARYSTGIMAENRYLNATTAAEAMHRELVPSKRKSVDLEDPLVKALIESYPEDERKLLSDRVRNMNDESFQQRLQFIYDKTRPFSEELAPNGEKWAATVKKVRNNLTHQKGSRAEKVPPADKLNMLGESVFLLISAYILVELGFPAAAVSEWLIQDRNARFFIDALRASYPDFSG